MSVILLHNSPAAEAVLRRHGTFVHGGLGFMLLSRSALTPELLSALLGGDQPDPRVTRTEHDLGQGYKLRVTHDCRVMGPPGLRNLGPGEYQAPWGIWLVYRGANISDCAGILEEAVPAVLESVKQLAAAKVAKYPVTYKAPERPRKRFRFAWSRDVLDIPPLSAQRERM